MDFRYKRKYQAQAGADGMKKKQYGKKGEDLVINVPVGTVVIDEESGLVMRDLTEDGDSFVAAKGGKGGKGNVHYKSSVRQAPNFAEAGGEAKERTVILELKSIADVGLVGFPNVGKSTILSVATSARPKIANYHFTTIDPNLGVADLGHTSFVLADIAGIIEGAHEGAGLGFYFLKHIERTKVLIHVIDVSGCEGRDPVEDMDKINEELRQYSEKLLKKPQIIAANKMDILEEGNDNFERLKAHAEEMGYEIYPMSAASGKGVKEILNAASRMLQLLEEEPPETEPVETFDFEKEDKDPDYRKIEAFREEGSGIFVLSGKQLHKIFDSTNFNDLGSLRYLYKYLEKNMAIERLKEMGLKEGDTVRIRDFEFEYYDD